VLVVTAYIVDELAAFEAQGFTEGDSEVVFAELAENHIASVPTLFEVISRHSGVAEGILFTAMGRDFILIGPGFVLLCGGHGSILNLS